MAEKVIVLIGSANKPRSINDPVTDAGKRSKAGRLMLLERQGAYCTARSDDGSATRLEAQGWTPALRPVFQNGHLLVDDSFDAVRQRAGR